MVPVSIRMKAIADMITEGLCVADIGCDHGFVSIYLIEQAKAKRCIAMDVRKGPLMRAREHILQYGVEDRIETRLSDGARELKPDEANGAIIAGMGGWLTIKILEESADKFKGMSDIVLSPQSDIHEVRKWLISNGFSIDDEDMVIDEDKYYVIIKCHYADENANLLHSEEYYGPKLLGKKHPVLKEYLTKNLEKNEEIIARLKKELESALADKKEALELRISELQDMNLELQNILKEM